MTVPEPGIRPPGLPRKRRRRSVAWLLPVFLALMLLNVGASGWLLDRLPACPFRELTGYSCPGCGSARALSSLARGDLTAALRLNPFVVLSLPLLLALVAVQRIESPRRPGLPRRLRAAVLVFLVTCAALYGILRNVPSWSLASLLD